MALTDPALSKAKWEGRDRWLSDGGSRGAGRLVAKVAENAVLFYFCYVSIEAKRRFLPMGHYGPKTGGLSLAGARDIAAEHSKLYRGGVKNLHDHYRRESEATEARHQADEASQRRAEQMAKSGSLRRLLECYSDHLERAGKHSSLAVRSSFQRHVYVAFPELCEKRGSTITTADLRQIIAPIVAAGKGREAAKLRSYLRAAYSRAIKAVNDPTAAEDLHAMGIEANPAANLAAMAQFNRTLDRVLSADELRHYLLRVQALPAESAPRDALMLSLLLGGQRPTQLLRVCAADVDLGARFVTLRDPKGARKQARLHALPLTDRTAEIFARLIAADDDASHDKAPSLFTSDGAHATHVSTLSHVISDISTAMVEAKEARTGFQMRDVRRTVETMLAGLGVQRDTRAQLLSHGLSGVQNAHYDRHDYEKEKREALEAWERRLEEISSGTDKRSNVIEFHRDQAA